MCRRRRHTRRQLCETELSLLEKQLVAQQDCNKNLNARASFAYRLVKLAILLVTCKRIHKNEWSSLELAQLSNFR